VGVQTDFPPHPHPLPCLRRSACPPHEALGGGASRRQAPGEREKSAIFKLMPMPGGHPRTMKMVVLYFLKLSPWQKVGFDLVPLSP